MLETTNPVEPTTPSETTPHTFQSFNQHDLKKFLVGFLLDRKILIDEESLFILDDLTQDPPISFSASFLSQFYESEAKQTHPASLTTSSHLKTK